MQTVTILLAILALAGRPDSTADPLPQLIGGGGEDVGLDVAIDGDDHSWVVGYFSGVASIGDRELTSEGGRDGFLARFDPAGTCLWAVAIGGTGDDVIHGVAVDGDGHARITGLFRGDVDFDPGEGERILAHGGALAEQFLARFAPDGKCQWTVTLGPRQSLVANRLSDDVRTDVAVNDKGNAYVVSNFRGRVDLDPGDGDAWLDSAGAVRCLLARYDADGRYEWGTVVGDRDHTVIANTVIVSGPNCYVGGSVATPAIIGDVPVGQPSPRLGLFVARAGAQGKTLWAHTLFGERVESSPRTSITGGGAVEGLAPDGKGGVYVTGTYMGKIDCQPHRDMKGDTLLRPEIHYGGFVLAFAKNGKLRNLFQIDEPGFGGSCHDIAVAKDGRIHVTGAVGRTVQGQQSQAVFVAQYKKNGKRVWRQMFGGSENRVVSQGFAIALDSQKNVVTTGRVRGRIEVGAEPTVLETHGYDAFLVRYGKNGKQPR